ncbi:DUF3558 domain-containing protein [Bounagaea algeriensis]
MLRRPTLGRPTLGRPTLGRTALGTTAVLAALGLAGCATPTDAGSEDQQPSSPAESTPSQQQNAPQIDQPKNLQAVGGACELLTPEQLQQLGLGGEPEPVDTLSGDSACDWSHDNGAVTVTPKSTIGAQQMYENTKTFNEFHPAEVQGYPANHKDRQSRLCSVDIGVSDSATVRVDFTRYAGDAPEMQDPCGYADTIATEVLKNIPDA